MDNSIEAALSVYASAPMRPSIVRLVGRIRDKLRNTKPMAVGVPYAVNVLYEVGGAGWRAKRDRKTASAGALFHLAAPSMGVVAERCTSALSETGVVPAGQIVHVTSSKVAAPHEQSTLTVTVTALWEACVIDVRTREQKVLEWYVERCRISGEKTSYKAYRAVLRAIHAGAEPASILPAAGLPPYATPGR